MTQNQEYEDECGDHGGINRFREPCGRPAGWGTDFDSGKCKHHRGTSPDGSSHDNNAHAETHGLHADRAKFYDRLSEAKQARVDELEAALIERYEEFHGREPDSADARDLFEIAVGYVQRDYARDWLAENSKDGSNPMTEEQAVGQCEDGSPITVEMPARINELLITSRREDRLMKKHMGLFRDPDTQQAEATETLAEVLQE